MGALSNILHIKYLPRAARIHFLPASILPFALGTAFAARAGYDIRLSKLIPASVGIASAHLSGNLFNDLFDYKSGADGVSTGKSPFFGGSGVIQGNVMSAFEVSAFALIFLSIALICGLTVILTSESRLLSGVIAAAAILTVEYTAPPLRLAYRRMGEMLIFMLFGILPVMGGFYIFSQRITLHSFQLALPLSFLIFSVIICNEIPDSSADAAAGKKNLVSLIKTENGFILYGVSILASLLAFTHLISNGVISNSAVAAALLYIPALAVTIMLHSFRGGLKTATLASAVTVITHFLIGAYMILNILISK